SDTSNSQQEVPLKDRKQYKTDTGRTVYGGGGITPDVFVKPTQTSRTTQLLEVRSAIFNYAVEYAAKHPDLNKDLVITPQIVDDFAAFAATKDIAPASDIKETLAKPEDRHYIERQLKAEIIAAKYGFDASYPYRLEGDTQVEKALELFPEAQKLSALASDARGKNGAPGANDAGTRAAQAVPKTK